MSGRPKSKLTAGQKGVLRKRRRHRAERREATKDIRETFNEKMRRIGHPGWVSRPKIPSDSHEGR